MNSHLQDINFVRHCYYLNPEIQNASDNLHLCTPPNNYVKKILLTTNQDSYNICSLNLKKQYISHQHHDKYEKYNIDIHSKNNQTEKKHLIEGMISMPNIIENGPGEYHIPPGKLPDGYELNNYGDIVKVCNNCKSNSHLQYTKPFEYDACFSDGDICDKEDDIDLLSLNRQFDDRFIKMNVFL